MAWQLQEAKQKLSEVVDRALDEGPQVVTRHGEEVVVVVSMQEYRRLTKPRPDFKRFLLEGPDLAELELERRPDMPRDVDW
jgi:prevent-host-death family protein